MTLVLAATLLLSLPQGGTTSRPASLPASRLAAPSALSGVVFWKGELPTSDAKPEQKEACAVDSESRIANVLVSLVPLQGQDLSRVPPPQLPVSSEAAPQPTDDEPVPAVITMKGGILKPRVQAMRVDQTFVCENEDDRPVNFDGTSPRTRIAFTMSVEKGDRKDIGAIFGGRMGLIFQSGDVLTICDKSKPGPKAFLRFVDVDGGVHRVTGNGGAFRFDGLPPGRYRIDVWHESGRTAEKEVLLAGGRPSQVAVELGANTPAPLKPQQPGKEQR